MFHRHRVHDVICQKTILTVTALMVSVLNVDISYHFRMISFAQMGGRLHVALVNRGIMHTSPPG